MTIMTSATIRYWLMVLALLAAAFGAYRPTELAAQPAPQLQIAPLSLDFGDTYQLQVPPLLTVTVSNIGNVDLAFQEGGVSSPASLSVYLSCTLLHPDESCPLTVQLDTRVIGPGQSTFDAYAYVPNSNLTVQPVQVTAKWNLIPGPIVLDAQQLNFGMRPLASSPTAGTLGLTNVSPIDYDIDWRVAGTSCATFDVTPPLCIAEASSYGVSGTCSDHLGPGQSCELTIAFQPAAPGNLIAQLCTRPDNSAYEICAALVGGGSPVPKHTPQTVLAVEYFNASLGHYFLTVTPQEMALLDAGLPLPGWQRTGLSFWVFPADGSAPAGSNPVCRFYGRPEAGIGSHFYSASPQECQAVIDKFSWGWVLESPAYFYAFLPTNDGGCPDAAVSLTAIVRLYRTYNNRPDANHRFTTSQYIQGLMQYSQNWIPEGYGLYSVAMCLPY
jgi:hypothetical protein